MHNPKTHPSKVMNNAARTGLDNTRQHQTVDDILSAPLSGSSCYTIHSTTGLTAQLPNFSEMQLVNCTAEDALLAQLYPTQAA